LHDLRNLVVGPASDDLAAGLLLQVDRFGLGAFAIGQQGKGNADTFGRKIASRMMLDGRVRVSGLNPQAVCSGDEQQIGSGIATGNSQGTPQDRSQVAKERTGDGDQRSISWKQRGAKWLK
jgi:hypothetical protein